MEEDTRIGGSESALLGVGFARLLVGTAPIENGEPRAERHALVLIFIAAAT